MRLFPRLAAVFGIVGTALLLPASPAAQQKNSTEGVTTTYLHIVTGHRRILQIMQSTGPVSDVSKLKLVVYAVQGMEIGDKLVHDEKTGDHDKITGIYDDLKPEYDRAWHTSDNCRTLMEGISTTPESVLGFNVVVLGPRREEATLVAQKKLETYKEWRPDLKQTYTTCPPASISSSLIPSPSEPLKTGKAKAPDLSIK